MLLRVLSILGLASAACLAAVTPARAASALTPADIRLLLTSPERRVRATDAIVERLLAEGLRRSSTLADLVVALNRSSVIVYIQSARQLHATLDGRLMLSPGARGLRYLRIQIRSDGT